MYAVLRKQTPVLSLVSSSCEAPSLFPLAVCITSVCFHLHAFPENLNLRCRMHRRRHFTGEKKSAAVGLRGTPKQRVRKSSRLSGNKVDSDGLRKTSPEKTSSGRILRTMSTSTGSTSENTKTDDDAIASGMMNLAIVCAHVQREATSEVLPAGKVEDIFAIELSSWQVI